MRRSKRRSRSFRKPASPNLKASAISAFPRYKVRLLIRPWPLLMDFWFWASVQRELSQAMQSIKSGQTLDKVPAFAAAETAYRTANEVFGYVDTKRLVERSYPKLRQIIIFGAAIMPGASDIIDGSKLPETETIARHLQPIVYGQTRIRKAISLSQVGRSR